MFVPSKYVVDIFTTERDGRKEDIEYAIAENERLETELELRHDIFEVMRVLSLIEGTLTFATLL